MLCCFKAAFGTVKAEKQRAADEAAAGSPMNSVNTMANEFMFEAFLEIKVHMITNDWHES